MRCGRQGELAAFVLGERDGAGASSAEAIRAHVAACASCAEEARWIAAEQALFTRRRELAAPAPPPFAAVMARARRGEGLSLRERAARPARVGSMLAAAAVLLGVLVTRPERRGEPAEIVAEPPMELSCFEGQPIAVEMEAFVTDRAIASVEDQYDACMVATPLLRPLRGHAACAAPVDHAVTCDPLGPLEGEAVE